MEAHLAFKYIPHFPKPVLDDLLTGKWLPVVGAGMSLNAVTPPGKQMPLWPQLAKDLTDELGDFSPTSVLDGISAYEHEFGRTRLIERLSEILLIREAQPGTAPGLQADLARCHRQARPHAAEGLHDLRECTACGRRKV
jgi:hypothetical protein